MRLCLGNRTDDAPGIREWFVSGRTPDASPGCIAVMTPDGAPSIGAFFLCSSRTTASIFSEFFGCAKAVLHRSHGRWSCNERGAEAAYCCLHRNLPKRVRLAKNLSRAARCSRVRDGELRGVWLFAWHSWPSYTFIYPANDRWKALL